MLDVIIPVYSPAPFEGLSRCIQSVLSNTPDCNLIVVNSDKSQPININRGLNNERISYNGT
jgi:glycosyltransferase involved in cell wall biosynthesis